MKYVSQNLNALLKSDKTTTRQFLLSLDTSNLAINYLNDILKAN